MSHIIGQLWPGHEVALCPSTFDWGGAWSCATPEKPHAFDQGLIKFAYERLVAMDHPYLIDVGASTGSFSLLPLFVPGMRCWSFEPQPGVYEVLQQNVKLNGLQPRVTMDSLAISDHRGSALLRCSRKRGQSGLASLRDDHGWSSVSVQATTLDWLCHNRYLWHDVSLVKIDVEGWELAVLRGGKGLWRALSPALLIEYKHAGLAAITALLGTIGYQWKTLGHRDLYAWKKEGHVIT